MPLFNLVRVPPFHAIWVGDWKLKRPVRYFIAAQALNDFREVIGLPVIDEFATFSGAILFGPASALGKLYNAGISVGHWRDSEMSIDTGWPPLAVSTGESVTQMEPEWEQKLLQQIKDYLPAEETGIVSAKVEEFVLQTIRFGEATVLATDAPLLPRQLRRLCQSRRAPFTIAFSTANVVTRQDKAALLSLRAVSEKKLRSILEAAQSIA